MTYRCKNCGFIFDNGIVKSTDEIKHQFGVCPAIKHTKIHCPKCDSDALVDEKEDKK